MALARILTIGVYGFTADQFSAALQSAGVDTLLDLRQRRGVRGAEYAFANRARLEAALTTIGIRYLYEPRLAPTTEMRSAQYAIDKSRNVAKRQRDSLSPEYVAAYTREILEPFDLREFVASLPSETRAIALFCVERTPEACHRHLVADALASLTGLPVDHVIP